MVESFVVGDVVEETVIIYDSRNNIEVGTLTRRINDAAEVEYIFNINWDAEDDIIISGLDEDLRAPRYVRHHSITFMTDFMPPACREDVTQLMLSVGLNMPYDMWAYMIEQGRVCRDPYRVKRIPGATYEHDKYKCEKIKYP